MARCKLREARGPAKTLSREENARRVFQGERKGRGRGKEARRLSNLGIGSGQLLSAHTERSGLEQLGSKGLQAWAG